MPRLYAPLPDETGKLPLWLEAMARVRAFLARHIALACDNRYWKGKPMGLFETVALSALLAGMIFTLICCIVILVWMIWR